MPEEATGKIRVTCPHCDVTIKAPAKYAGRKVKCPAEACQQSFVVPTPEPPAEENEFLVDFDDAPAPAAPATSLMTPTFASNPGGVPMNPLRWWRHKPLWPAVGLGGAVATFLLWLGLTAAGVKASITNKQGGETPIWLFGLAGLATVVFYTWRSSRMLKSGDANPGVVVSLNPTLIAVPTDLTQGHGEFPAVKIVKVNLVESNGQPLEIGSRVPTVANYALPPNKQANHWGDFYPVPAEYATGDPRVVQRLLDSFPDEQFGFLQQALAIIPQPYQPGLYALWEAPGKPAGRRINKLTDF